ncbi:MAG: hypothetical protein QM767_16795 [Anaeromyxobacter sp.]
MAFVGHRLLLIVGLIVAVGAGWQIGKRASAWLSAPGQPAPGDAASPPGRYVRLQGVALDCATLRRSPYGTLALAAGGGAVILVQWVGEARCEDGLPEGAFLPDRFSRGFVRTDLGIDLPPGPDLRVFAEAGAPAQQRRAAVKLLPWLAAGLVLAATGWRGLRRLAAADGRKSGRGPGAR